jgi:hypothetical protein
MGLMVGLDLGRVWPRRRIAAGSIRRRNGLLMLKMTGWRWRHHLLQQRPQTLDSSFIIIFFSGLMLSSCPVSIARI